MTFTVKEQLELREIMRKIRQMLLLVLLWLGTANIYAEHGHDYFEKLGVNLLRTVSTGGFSEYEFLSDGRLVAYSYLRDGTDSGPDIVDNTFLTKFKIDFLRWEIKGKYIFIYRGNRRSKSEIRNDERHVYFNEKTWLRVNQLKFFDEVSKHTGKSIILESMKKRSGEEEPKQNP